MDDEMARPDWVPEGAGREYASHVRKGVEKPSTEVEKTSVKRPGLTVDEYVQGVRSGNRSILARAITLVESNRSEHADKAQQVLAGVMELTGRSTRLGITGVPGVGKSSFIEALGTRLCREGHKVAVLAVDPSSSISGGSVLGDKTRMELLSREPNAFIRPSPSAGNLGGVGRKSRETLLLCEAAGFDVILVETVGVGQGETEVHSMVDVFVLLMLAGAGDELQGIKKGIMELADLILVTKADGDNVERASRAKAELASVVRGQMHEAPGWQIPAMTVSVKDHRTLQRFWEKLGDFLDAGRRSGYLPERRRRQVLSWVHFLVQEELRRSFENDSWVKAVRPRVESEVISGHMPHLVAVKKMLEGFRYP